MKSLNSLPTVVRFRGLASGARVLGAVLLLALHAGATGGTVTGFDGTNVGGWSYGPPPAIETTGGNPGAWLHVTTDTFAPQLRNNALNTQFTGDYRAQKIVSLGTDLITKSTQFQNSRPLSLILSNGDCEIYFLSDQFVPQPGAGWKSFNFAIDSPEPDDAARLGHPHRKLHAQGSGLERRDHQRDADHLLLRRPDVPVLRRHLEHRADNVRIYSDPFTDLDGALAGGAGTPKLAGSGTLAASTPVTLALSNAAPSSATALFVGLSALNAPFKGGTLVPNPDVVVPGLLTDGAGQLTLASTWPPGIPSGFSMYFQAWVADAGGPQGFAASNGLQGTTP